MRAFSLLHFHSRVLHSKVSGFFFCLFSSTASPAPAHSSRNPLIFNYLTRTFTCSEKQALWVSNDHPSLKTLDKPQSVVQFLEEIGFSKSQIQYTVRVSPGILFCSIEKNLKPKLNLFQELGLTGDRLGEFISKNPSFLNCSLENTLMPQIDLIRKVLVDDKDNQDLIWVLRRVSRFRAKVPEPMLLRNIAFLKSCNIVGPRLVTMFKTRPWVLLMPESALRDLVSRVLNMGFSVDSGMLVYALQTVSSMSAETFNRKLDLLKRFGFSDNECIEMFRRFPSVLKASEAKLKFGIEFFLNDAKVERSTLVRRPICLICSMEKRVKPRYRVLQVLKLKRLLKKELSVVNVLEMSEAEFLEKFISPYGDDAEELLATYKGNLLDSSRE
ncbi:transcription termination factor MTERF9, chloroplastic-like [Diospyros lotus]|uniref:transcription termination factor MTERF9, chloroplastic-like n=1 Tax=Diospyros lotus TaxID=55363 RepID=UPI00224CD108|nr:transcription termination factor MTERF9, chloroplastic-like [Diospyros lotus]